MKIAEAKLGKIANKLKSFALSEDALARVFRNSAWMSSAKGFGAVASLFYLAVLTRSLGPAGFGQFILIVSTVQILAAVVRLQTWQTVVHFGSPLIIKEDKPGFSRLVFEELMVEICGALAAIALLWILIDPLSVQFEWSPKLGEGLLLYGLIIFLSLRSTTTGILRANDRFKDAAIGDAAIPAVRLIGAIFLLVIGPSVNGFLIVWGLSETASSLVQWGLVLKRKFIGRPAPRVKRDGYWQFLFATNASYILAVLRERGPVLIVGLYVGDAAAGLFRLADQLASGVNRLTELFSRPLFTEMSRLFALGDMDRSRDLFFRSLRIFIATGGAIMVLLLLLGWPLIYLMSGEEFLPAYPLLLILGGSTILGLASLSFEPLLQAAGHPGKAFFARFAGLSLVVVLLFFWLVPYGVVGASWAMLTGAVLTLMIVTFMVHGQLGALRAERPKAQNAAGSMQQEPAQQTVDQGELDQVDGGKVEQGQVEQGQGGQGQIDGGQVDGVAGEACDTGAGRDQGLSGEDQSQQDKPDPDGV